MTKAKTKGEKTIAFTLKKEVEEVKG